MLSHSLGDLACRRIVFDTLYALKATKYVAPRFVGDMVPFAFSAMQSEVFERGWTEPHVVPKMQVFYASVKDILRCFPKYSEAITGLSRCERNVSGLIISRSLIEAIEAVASQYDCHAYIPSGWLQAARMKDGEVWYEWYFEFELPWSCYEKLLPDKTHRKNSEQGVPNGRAD